MTADLPAEADRCRFATSPWLVEHAVARDARAAISAIQAGVIEPREVAGADMAISLTPIPTLKSGPDIQHRSTCLRLALPVADDPSLHDLYGYPNSFCLIEHT